MEMCCGASITLSLLCWQESLYLFLSKGIAKLRRIYHIETLPLHSTIDHLVIPNLLIGWTPSPPIRPSSFALRTLRREYEGTFQYIKKNNI